MGGGIYNNGGTVSISDSTISDNTAAAGEGSNSGLGGGIYNSSGTVAISDSTISGNTAAAGAEIGGGSGGGIFDAGGTFSISESTISGNTAAASGGSGAGGGIFADDSTLTVVDSTISGNTAPPADEGGGIFFGDGTNVLAGDIFATPGGPPAGRECAGSTPTDDGYNVDDDGTCGFSATGSVSDSSAIDGYLGQLQNNGGPTDTVALLPGTSGTPNPAQAVIPASFTAPGQSTAVCAQPDQRGASRVDPCDVGAYALTANLYALPDGTAPAPCTTESATPSLVCSFATAVDEADSGTNDVINLEAPSGDTVYTGVSAGGVQAAITSPVAIQADIDPGFNTAVPVLDGENNGTVLSIPGNDDVTITGIDIENGAAPFGSHGGAIFNGGTGTVSVSDSTFSDNSGGGGGAISNSNGGTLDVSDSTFTDNGSDGGGAIDNGTDDAGTGTLVVSDSTFYDNEARNYSGGAILNGYGSGDDGIATISDSTFYGNTAFFDDGGAVDNGSNGGTGTLTVANSTFVGTGVLEGAIENGGSGTGTVTVSADVFADSCGQASGTWNDGGYNVGIDESCFDAGTADNDSAGSALSGLLGPLSDNGGPTQTVQPLAGNPAIGIVPNPLSGLCPVTQDQRGYPSATGAACNAGAMQVLPSEQTIGSLSTAPSGVVVGGATYTPSATASSGLGVSITVDSSSSGVCAISAGVVSFNAVGTCTLDFNQAGNANFAPAPEVQQGFPVAIGPQTIGSISNRPNDPVVGGPVYFPSATATSGLAVSITVDPSSSAVCSISAGLVSFNAVGTCAVDFNQAGSANWLPATQEQQATIIGRGTQTITVTSVAPGNAVVAGPTYTPSATATSGLDVSITVDPSSSAVCSISAGVVSFNEAGTCTVDFDQGGNVNWKAAQQVQQSFSVLAEAQTITVTSAAPSSTVVGGPTYTPSATATWVSR